MKFDFENLFIYDMANNHQGSVVHGLKIIDRISKVSNEMKVRGALKFQFRELNTFIHEDYKKSDVSKHIPRFLSTRLSRNDFKRLTKRVKDNGLITISTPFDEPSVDLINELDIELIKVASCSSQDWSLLKKIVTAGKPVVCSTGGLNIKQIDAVVDFFERNDTHFALMHCVPLYPTLTRELQLNQIATLCNRYPTITIGFSTHEEPDNYTAIMVAYAMGARIFERHVGVKTIKLPKLNAYSSDSNQIKYWLIAHNEAVKSCGAERRPPATQEVIDSLNSLKRGVWAKEKILKGQYLRDKVYFAMPLLKGQLDSSHWFDELKADTEYNKDEPLSNKLALQNKISIREQIIKDVVLQVKGLLNNAKIFLSSDSEIELSHHYGIERFREYGAVIVNIINREYCKKLVIQLPSQRHPYHYHKKKTETFHVIYGDLEIEKNGVVSSMKPGELIHIEKGEWHKFTTNHGVIIEEISTTHYNDDSFYEDEIISLMPREERKTILK
jgi:N-acetylneuraminate synthase